VFACMWVLLHYCNSVCIYDSVFTSMSLRIRTNAKRLIPPHSVITARGLSVWATWVSPFNKLGTIAVFKVHAKENSFDSTCVRFFPLLTSIVVKIPVNPTSTLGVVFTERPGRVSRMPRPYGHSRNVFLAHRGHAQPGDAV